MTPIPHRFLRRIRFDLVFLLALFVSGSASAHRAQYTLTELRWSVNTRSLEVIHSIHLDDAMALLSRLGSPTGELDLETRAKVMLYVEDKFGLERNAESIELAPVGVQIEGDYLWVYQKLDERTIPAGLSVTSTILFEINERQQHQVNLVVGGDVRTVLLNRENPSGGF